MHYFHKLSSASGGSSPQTPTGMPSLDPTGGLSSPNLPTAGKNSEGAHGQNSVQVTKPDNNQLCLLHLE